MLDRLSRYNPLLLCLLVALILRLPAVIFSRGYMASDDHFETVQIAYDGIQRGLLNEDGTLRWERVASDDIGRSPLYVLFLFFLMKLQYWIGISRLDTMMYFIRMIHAVLSLLTVYFGVKYIADSTNSRKVALAGGLILAGHFLMPYLAVRNLIEQVSADLLLPAVYLAYKGFHSRNGRVLLLAGILGGLSWMIRFNTGLAVLPIPFALWYLARNIRPALYFVAGGVLVVLFSGSLDIQLLGCFGRSSVNIMERFIFPSGPPPLPQPFWIFAVLILGILIPPFSFYFVGSIFNRTIIKRHIVAFSAAACFFLVHSLITHKEERFMVPIFPLIVILGTVGLHEWLSSGRLSARHWKILKVSAIAALGLNILLLPIFTLNYAHRGTVDSMVYLSKQSDVIRYLVDRTERKLLAPYSYAGIDTDMPILLDRWEMLDTAAERDIWFDSVNYLVVFSDTAQEIHRQRLATYFGDMTPVYHAPPSLVDMLLHFLNPRHNHTNEAWVYRRIGAPSIDK